MILDLLIRSPRYARLTVRWVILPSYLSAPVLSSVSHTMRCFLIELVWKIVQYLITILKICTTSHNRLLVWVSVCQAGTLIT